MESPRAPLDGRNGGESRAVRRGTLSHSRIRARSADFFAINRAAVLNRPLVAAALVRPAPEGWGASWGLAAKRHIALPKLRERQPWLARLIHAHGCYLSRSESVTGAPMLWVHRQVNPGRETDDPLTLPEVPASAEPRPFGGPLAADHLETLVASVIQAAPRERAESRQ